MASLQTHTALGQAKRHATNTARLELWVLNIACRSFGQYSGARIPIG